jgi:flagellar motor switch protein FliN/FliY
MASLARSGNGMTAQIRDLFEQFAANLAQVFESMAEQSPTVSCEALAPLPVDEEMLWWEQPLQFAPGMKIWAGAARATWEYAGALTLKAAGLDTVEESEARNTWLEILGQALSTLARSIGAVLGREVTCENGSEHAPDDGIESWVPVRLTFGDTPLAPLYLAFSMLLMDAISAPPPTTVTESAPEAETEAELAALPTRSRTMGLLLDVDLPVSISFGKTQLAMRDVIKLTTGSIVELNRGVNEPVEVLVNQCLVARGEVVVVDGNYGVRILEIVSRPDRMRSIR